jgi:hypothetical protein
MNDIFREGPLRVTGPLPHIQHAVAPCCKLPNYVSHIDPSSDFSGRFDP